jgi:hypothetical protein
MTNEILEVYALMERELYRLESLIKSLSSMSNQDLTLDELTILLAKHSSSTRKYEKLESLIYFSGFEVASLENKARNAFHSAEVPSDPTLQKQSEDLAKVVKEVAVVQ